jgi:uncharacterized protein YvpB
MQYITRRLTSAIFALLYSLSLTVGCSPASDFESDTADSREKLYDHDNHLHTPITGDAERFNLDLNDTCENPCGLAVRTTLKVDRVVYEADNWLLGESADPSTGYAISYTFNTLGQRMITARGFKNQQLVEEATLSVKVSQPEVVPPSIPEAEGPLPEVPYFYQYDNGLYPGASCQNTSIAMVLAYLGWSGKPDDITREFGKNYAQSPAGLADVFNRYVSRSSLGMNIEPTTTGSLSGLRAALDRGHPAIIHGYFTRSGHVVVVLGYDDQGYYVHDPAGMWSQTFMGGYSGGGSGYGVYYRKSAFESAVATSNGSAPLALWYHALR